MKKEEKNIKIENKAVIHQAKFWAVASHYEEFMNAVSEVKKFLHRKGHKAYFNINIKEVGL